MNDSLNSKMETRTKDQIELLEVMRKLRDAWLERRMRRVQVIQDLHC